MEILLEEVREIMVEHNAFVWKDKEICRSTKLAHMHASVDGGLNIQSEHLQLFKNIDA